MYNVYKIASLGLARILETDLRAWKGQWMSWWLNSEPNIVYILKIFLEIEMQSYIKRVSKSRTIRLTCKHQPSTAYLPHNLWIIHWAIWCPRRLISAHFYQPVKLVRCGGSAPSQSNTCSWNKNSQVYITGSRLLVHVVLYCRPILNKCNSCNVFHQNNLFQQHIDMIHVCSICQTSICLHFHINYFEILLKITWNFTVAETEFVAFSNLSAFRICAPLIFPLYILTIAYLLTKHCHFSSYVKCIYIY